MNILLLFTLIAVINAQNGTNITTNATGTTTPIRTSTASSLRGTTTPFHSTTISAKTTTDTITTTTYQSTTTDTTITTTSTRPIEKTTIIPTTTMVPTTTIMETTTFIQTTSIAPYCNNETMNTSCIKCIGYLCKFVEKGNQGVGMELLFLGAFIGFIGLLVLALYYYCIKPILYHNVPTNIYWTSDDDDDEATLLSRRDINRKTTPPGMVEMTTTLN